MTQGQIERITEAGRICGWAAGPTDRPVQVRLRIEGEPVAQGLADQFRRDLMLSGRSHGHFGFDFQIMKRPALPGRRLAELVIEPGGGVPPVTLRQIIAVPPLPEHHASLPVESLLRREGRWTLPDIQSFIRQMNLPAYFEAWGADAFVDVALLYVLGRRPVPAEKAQAMARLEGGEVNSEEFFYLLLGSDAAKARDLSPAPPFDPDYPFTESFSRFLAGAAPSVSAG